MRARQTTPSGSRRHTEASVEVSLAEIVDSAVVQPVVAFLAELAAGQVTLESGIGTDCGAIPHARHPNARRSVPLQGVQFSPAMVARLRARLKEPTRSEARTRTEVVLGSLAEPMAKKPARTEYWKDDPDEHDFPSAGDYLGLLLSDEMSAAVVDELRGASTVRHKAKDFMMLSSRLPLLPSDDPEVAKDLKRVMRGESLSPVLLVRGQAAAGLPLIVADGYHRICASYHLSGDAEIPCRIAELG